MKSNRCGDDDKLLAAPARPRTQNVRCICCAGDQREAEELPGANVHRLGMQRTVVPGISMWSRWQADRQMDFNSWFIVSPDGNAVVDPLPPDEDDLRQIDEAGGVAWVIVTNRDHERAAKTFVERFGAQLAVPDHDAGEIATPAQRRLRDGDDILGWRVIALDGFKTRGEIVMYSREHATAIVGDALWGDPAGSLRFMPDAKLADPERAVLSMRRVRGLPQLDRLLVGDGAPVFRDGRRVLGECIDARGLAATLRINFADVPMTAGSKPEMYAAHSGEIGLLLGAEHLGYRLARIPTGTAFCPMHWHTAEEEVFIVWSGAPTLMTSRGDVALRSGDCIAFPCGDAGAHKIRNDAAEDAVVFMLAKTDTNDVCFYPDSNKVLIDRTGLLLRAGPELDYYEGET